MVDPTPDARIELTNGRLVDVVAGRYLAPTTRLIIEGPVIKALPGLPGVDQGPPPDFTVDLQGRTVIPGLFNTHVHLQLCLPALALAGWDIAMFRFYIHRQIDHSLADCLIHGVTTVRDAWSEDLDGNRVLKERISSRRLLGPRVLQAVVVSMDGSVWAPRRGFKSRIEHLATRLPYVDYQNVRSGVVPFPPWANERQVRDAVDRAIDERGADCIKIYEQRNRQVSFKPGAPLMSAAQLGALTDQARRRGRVSTMHHFTVESFRRGVNAGVGSLAHMPMDSVLTENDIRGFIDAGCILEPTATLAVGMCWPRKDCHNKNPDRLQRLEQLRLRSTTEWLQEYWLPELSGTAASGLRRAKREHPRLLNVVDLAPVYRYHFPIITHGMDNIRRLHQRGAILACGNDAGIPPSTPAMIKPELRLMDFAINESGDSRSFGAIDALRAATIHSAQALGLEGKLGSIDVGKIADLVVLDGDPLLHPEIIGDRVAGLFMDGRLVVNRCGLRLDKVSHRPS